MADISIEAPGLVRRGAPARVAARPRVSASARALVHTLATDRPTAVEWAVTVGALFILGRFPVLFFRERLSDLFGGGPEPVWQNDVAVQATFGVAIAMALVFGVRRARPSSLLRQPALLAFCAVVWASISWSVEPATSLRRALLFAGAAGVGWYAGDRFSLPAQIRLVAYTAAVGLALSLMAIAVWPELAMTTNWVVGLVSGVYINRNPLGHILGIGVLASLFLLRTDKRSLRPLFAGLAGSGLFMIDRTGNRTATVALGSTVVILVLFYLVRRLVGRRLGTWVTGLAAAGAISATALWLFFNLESFLRTMGRTESLSGRIAVWEFDLWLARLNPVQGWGFEAIWAHPHTIELGHQATGRFPYSSHSGFFEVLLGLGWVGFGFLCLFLLTGLWQVFRLAAKGRDAASLWPLAAFSYAILINISDSHFVSSDFFWALTVAAIVGATEANRRIRLAAPRRT